MYDMQTSSSTSRPTSPLSEEREREAREANIVGRAVLSEITECGICWEPAYEPARTTCCQKIYCVSCLLALEHSQGTNTGGNPDGAIARLFETIGMLRGRIPGLPSGEVAGGDVNEEPSAVVDGDVGEYHDARERPSGQPSEPAETLAQTPGAPTTSGILSTCVPCPHCRCEPLVWFEDRVLKKAMETLPPVTCRWCNKPNIPRKDLKKHRVSGECEPQRRLVTSGVTQQQFSCPGEVFLDPKTWSVGQCSWRGNSLNALEEHLKTCPGGRMKKKQLETVKNLILAGKSTGRCILPSVLWLEIFDRGIYLSKTQVQDLEILLDRNFPEEAPLGVGNPMGNGAVVGIDGGGGQVNGGGQHNQGNGGGQWGGNGVNNDLQEQGQGIHGHGNQGQNTRDVDQSQSTAQMSPSSTRQLTQSQINFQITQMMNAGISIPDSYSMSISNDTSSPTINGIEQDTPYSSSASRLFHCKLALLTTVPIWPLSSLFFKSRVVQENQIINSRGRRINHSRPCEFFVDGVTLMTSDFRRRWIGYPWGYPYQGRHSLPRLEMLGGWKSFLMGFFGLWLGTSIIFDAYLFGFCRGAILNHLGAITVRCFGADFREKMWNAVISLSGKFIPRDRGVAGKMTGGVFNLKLPGINYRIVR